MSKIFVRLPEYVFDALQDLAEREWRDPRDQAALLLVEGLRQAGALSTEGTTELKVGLTAAMSRG